MVNIPASPLLDWPATGVVHPRPMRRRKIEVKAPAKINLFLEVLGERPDGYHGIRSVIVPVSLHDTIVIEETRGPVGTTMDLSAFPGIDPRILPGSAENVATKAALALRKAAGCRKGAAIHIVKRIPVCGGMGGGSSDAAAVLRGLNELWGTGFSVGDMLKIGAGLGSDMPAMIHGGPVLIEGRGEKVRGISVNAAPAAGSWWVLLVNPLFGVSTRDICSRYSKVLTSPPGTLKRTICAVERWDRDAVCGGLFNSLEKTVFAKYPLISMIAERMRDDGSAGVLLSGSGASVFALAESRAHASGIGRGIGRAFGSSLWRKVVKALPDGVTVAHSPLEARV